MNINDIARVAKAFGEEISGVKRRNTDINWYPYDSLSNIHSLQRLFGHDDIDLLPRAAASRVLDIGAADGDLAFLFERLGCTVDILDNAQTNYNDCAGIARMASALNSGVTLIQKDVDLEFLRLEQDYDLAIALGLLYHLRNPFAFLMGLALRCETMLLSTRIARTMGNFDLRELPVAYLLDTEEANRDPTNYWIFSEAGLLRVLKRAGWIVLCKTNMGCVDNSNPSAADRDERIFVYCRRVPNYQDLTVHHHF